MRVDGQRPRGKDEGHLPLFPPYLDKSYPLRTLAYEEEGVITTESGQIYRWEDWEDLKELLELQNLIILTAYIDPIVHVSIMDQKVKVFCSKDGLSVHCVSVRLGRKLRHIVPAHLWGVTEPGHLLTVRAFLSHCQVGDRITPSSTANAVARRVWQERKLPQHRIPSKACQKKIQRHKQPARSQTFVERDWAAPEAKEYDLRNAYAIHYGLHPTGTAIRIIAEGQFTTPHLVTWFQACIITIPKGGVPMAPFGVRRFGRWEYPTSNGTYGKDGKVWLWKEQAERCRKMGIKVRPIGGYGWERFTTNNKFWSARMQQLRETAPANIEQLVKKALVGGIGRQDMAGPIYGLVSGEPQPGDHVVLRPQRSRSDSPISSIFTRQIGYNYGGMAHWNSYTIMRANLTVFEMALAHRGELVMITFDALIFEATVPPPPARSWKSLTHHNCTVPAPGHFISDEVRRTPGVAHP